MTERGARNGKKEEMRPTMVEVAQLANVSLKTVSRVVNGEKVSERTASAVHKAIAELGYRRNDLARALRQDRASRLLGLVTKDVSNPFYSAIARGVEEVVRDRELLLVAGSSDEDAERERALLEVLCERRVGALIVVPTGSDHSFLASELDLGTPIAFIDRPPSNLAADTILLDNVGGAQSAVAHLLRQGHRKIALVGHVPEVFTTSERVRGYRVALRAAGVVPDERLVRLGCPDSDSAEAVMQELLEMADPPTAVFACNNRITLGALRALSLSRRRPALVGFDDFDFAPLLSPPVTVVSYDPVELGRQAARLICERLDGESGPPRQIVVPTELVARGSGEGGPQREQAL